MNYLIVNLSRFGDILQSQVLVAALKNSGHSVAMLTLENFSDSCDFISELDEKYALISSKLLNDVNNNDWQHAFSKLEQSLTALITEFRPDIILNITPSISARLLSLHVQSLSQKLGFKMSILGFGLDEQGFAINSSVWATYMLVASLQRGHSAMNLVDVFCKASSVSIDNKKFQLQCPEIDITKILPDYDSSKKYIAIQLGASNPARAYSAEHYAKFSLRFNSQDYKILLLGLASEEPYAETFYQAGGQALSLVGKTNMHELACVLKHSHILLTNDTGTMHLAAGLGLPIIGIFLATAQVFDTAPYIIDALLLEANINCHPCQFSQKCQRDHICQVHISPLYLVELCKAKLENKNFPLSALARLFTNYQDDYGFMRQKRLDINYYEHREAWSEIQYLSYRQFFDFVDSGESNLTSFSSIEPQLLKSLDLSIKNNICACLSQAIQVIGLLIMQGSLLAKNPKLSNSFLENNQRIGNILSENAELSLLANLWKTSGQDLGDNLDSFLDFSNKMKFFLEYLELNLSKKYEPKVATIHYYNDAEPAEL